MSIPIYLSTYTHGIFAKDTCFAVGENGQELLIVIDSTKINHQLRYVGYEVLFSDRERCFTVLDEEGKERREDV